MISLWKRTILSASKDWRGVGEAMMTDEKQLSRDQRELKEYCEERNINELVHFIRCTTLPSLLRYGLITQSILKNARQIVEDKNRADQKNDHVCMSVDFPNYKLFYKRRKERIPSESWCIATTSKSLIWERSCIFYPVNAAKDNGAYGQKGISGFKAMYAEKSGDIKRSTSINVSHTTNPQAEILIPDSIPPRMISTIYFQTDIDLEYFGEMVKIAGKNIQTREELFLPRADYRQWSTG